MEENKEYQIKRIESSSNEVPTNNKEDSKNTGEYNKIEEEKKLSTSRLFILFIILDCILGAFLILELVWLFFDFFTKTN